MKVFLGLLGVMLLTNTFDGVRATCAFDLGVDALAPLHFFKLDETSVSGSIVNSGTSGDAATYVGTWQNTDVGIAADCTSAYSFAKTESRAVFLDDVDVSNYQDGVSIAFRMRRDPVSTTALDSGDEHVVLLGNAHTTDSSKRDEFGFKFKEASGSSYTTRLVINGNYPVVSGVDILDGEWHNVVLTYSDTNQARVYIDGTLVLEAAKALVIGNYVVDLVIGARGYGVSWNKQAQVLNGDIDSVAYFNYELNAMQVALLEGTDAPTFQPTQQPTAQPTEAPTSAPVITYATVADLTELSERLTTLEEEHDADVYALQTRATFYSDLFSSGYIENLYSASSSGWIGIPGGRSLAQRFVAGDDDTLVDVTLVKPSGVVHTPLKESDNFKVSIYDEQGGEPGNELIELIGEKEPNEVGEHTYYGKLDLTSLDSYFVVVSCDANFIITSSLGSAFSTNGAADWAITNNAWVTLNGSWLRLSGSQNIALKVRFIKS